VDLDTLLALNANFKSQLIEWAQRQGKKVQFVIVDEKGASHRREFVAEVLLGGELLGRGTGLSKKKAEQAAAEKALSKTKF
jgi:ribonuclease-3